MLKLKPVGFVPAAFIIFSTIVLLALSAWQFKRLAWKEGLISTIETAMNKPAVVSAEGDVAYRKAMLTGRYLEDKTLHFVAQKSAGFAHFTPLKLEDSDEVVLINRGWFKAGESPVAESTTVTVSGVLRPFRAKRMFSPENAADKNVWFIENVDEIKAATGLHVAPYVLESGKLPALRNDHLGYAITWLLLAITGVVMFVIYFREK